MCCLREEKEDNLKPEQRGGKRQTAIPEDPGSTHAQTSPISKGVCWPWYARVGPNVLQGWHSVTGLKFLSGIVRFMNSLPAQCQTKARQSGMCGPGQLRGGSFSVNCPISPKSGNSRAVGDIQKDLFKESTKLSKQ